MHARANYQNRGPDTTAANTELLRTFYQRFFPWRYMFQWLNHSPTPTNDFKHREFSLWLPNDAVMRYQSYTASDLSVTTSLTLSVKPTLTLKQIPQRRVTSHADAYRNRSRLHSKPARPQDLPQLNSLQTHGQGTVLRY